MGSGGASKARGTVDAFPTTIGSKGGAPGPRRVAVALFTLGGVLGQAARVYLTAIVLELLIADELAWLAARTGIEPLVALELRWEGDTRAIPGQSRRLLTSPVRGRHYLPTPQMIRGGTGVALRRRGP
jgi:hypothetical protein